MRHVRHKSGPSPLDTEEQGKLALGESVPIGVGASDEHSPVVGVGQTQAGDAQQSDDNSGTHVSVIRSHHETLV